MAESPLTVTPPSPTPPTNFSFTGATPPNVPNYTKNTYNDPKNWSYVNPKDYPPPYFDDGTAGSLVVFATNTSALASGSAATAGGTEGTYPGAANGAVPASTSVAHEGAGTETVTNHPVSPLTPIQHTYPILPSGTESIYLHRQTSAGPVMTAARLAAGPNASHASYLTGTVGLLLPTITSVSAGGASGAGTTLLTVTGTNYTRASRVYVDGVLQTTNYTSATSIYVTNAPKKATAGNRAITVDNGVGTAQTSPTNWVFS